MKRKSDSGMQSGGRTVAAVLLTLVGVFLLIVSMWMDPLGEIHPSVIGAVGEVFTFAGALWGLKLNFDRKELQYKVELEKLKREHPLPEDSEES